MVRSVSNRGRQEVIRTNWTDLTNRELRRMERQRQVEVEFVVKEPPRIELGVWSNLSGQCVKIQWDINRNT